MKCLLIDGVAFRNIYCEYPDGINSIETFVKYMNENYNSFIKLVRYKLDNCVEPYFIAEEKETVYLNVSSLVSVSEFECTVLPKEEYERRLQAVVSEKCVHCQNYVECEDGDNLMNHRDTISLDGKCCMFEPKED